MRVLRDLLVGVNLCAALIYCWTAWGDCCTGATCAWYSAAAAWLMVWIDRAARVEAGG